MTQTISGPAIVRGHYYPPLRITVAGAGEPLFPEGCELRAQIRAAVWSKDIIAELTTENGGLARVSDDTIEMRILPEDTEKATANTVVLDFVRTDTDPDLYLYVQMTIPVQRPVTRSGGE